MARCAVNVEATGFLSGSYALRRLVWRGAQLNQDYQDESLGLARCA
ncbi:hypothetical protein A2U01_0085338, partial [Trifolium medium]|nr:hypothetical protein [Trifolium medium]